MIKITKYQLNNKLNKKIVLISDIHIHPTWNNKNFYTLLEEICKLNPNYVCIAGDFLDDANVSKEEIFKEFLNFLKRLGKLYPVIISLGNHDTEERVNKYKRKYCVDQSYQEKVKKIPNITLLNNESLIKDSIYFYGYTAPYRYFHKKEKDSEYLLNHQKRKIPNITNNYYKVLLMHSPINSVKKNFIEKSPINQFDLILCGHTHGGLMPEKLKINHGIVSPGKRLFPKNIRGKLVRGKNAFIISNGITKLSYSSNHFRHLNFLFPMSITLIEI